MLIWVVKESNLPLQQTQRQRPSTFFFCFCFFINCKSGGYWGLRWGWMIGLRANRCASNVLHAKLPHHGYNRKVPCWTAQVWAEAPSGIKSVWTVRPSNRTASGDSALERAEEKVEGGKRENRRKKQDLRCLFTIVQIGRSHSIVLVEVYNVPKYWFMCVEYSCFHTPDSFKWKAAGLILTLIQERSVSCCQLQAAMGLNVDV